MLKKYRRRVTVDLQGTQVEDLCTLERELGTTAVGVIRRALNLLKILHENEKNGGKTLLRNETGDLTTLELL